MSAQLNEALPPDAFQGDAHALLMAVYKDPGFDVRTRIDAAGKPLAYETPPTVQF